MWIVQAAIILGWLLLAKLGFAFQLLAWLRPADKQEEAAERVFGPLCHSQPQPFWRRRKSALPWLLVTGQPEQVEALLPGLIAERWQVSYRGIFLWCGEPGQITAADIGWLRRKRGRKALDALLWVTDINDPASGTDTAERTLWQQLKNLGRWLGWRLPIYTLVMRDDNGHDQYDRPRQSTEVCWTPGTPTDIATQLQALTPGLLTEGMAQIQHQLRWSWLLQLAQDIRQARFSPLAVALQPLVQPQTGVLLSGVFILPTALPGQHEGYRTTTLSPAWYGVLHQARIRHGRRDHLIFRDWLYRGAMVTIGLACAGMMLSAFGNYRLIRDNNTLLAQQAATTSLAEQYRHQRELQRQIETLLWRSREGTPLQLRFGLDQNQRQLDRLWPVWQQQNQQLLLNPVMAQLTSQLRQYVDLPAGSPERRIQAAAAYQHLKAYLMLAQPQRAEPEFLQQTLAPLWLARDPHITAGEWMMLSGDMLAFWAQELPRHPQWQQSSDSPLVAAVRTLLRNQNGLRNSESALYQSVLQQAEKRHGDLSLNTLLGENATSDLFFTDSTLAGVFTREAWEQDVRTLIANVAASRQVMTDWVLDEGKTANSPVLSEEALRNRLTERYFTDYAGAWLEFLNSIRWQPATTLSDTIDQLTLLGDIQRSPLPTLGKALRWQAGVGQEGHTVGESLLNSAKQLVAGDKTPQAQSPLTQASAPASQPAAVVVQAFAPLLAILPAEEGQKNSVPPANGLTLLDYLLQVTQVRLLLQQIAATSDPQAGMLALMQSSLAGQSSPLSTARGRGNLLAASLGQDWSGFASAAFSEPLNQTWQTVLEPATQALNDAWQKRVINSWQEAFSGRYPFATATNDASLPLLAHFIAPQSGVIEQFITQQLHGLVEKQGDEWVAVASGQQYMDINPAFLEAINLLSRLGRVAFAQGEANLSFDVQMYPMRDVVETNLQLDDAVFKYFNQQAEWQTFAWPNRQTATPQAVLSYQPLNNSGSAALPPVTAFAFDGSWAALRLFDKARTEQLDSSRWRLSWSPRNGPGLSLILRTQSYGGPLELLKLRDFKLPGTAFNPAQGGKYAQ
ncbi:ImcF-related family protein [Serratia sp. DD3]|uniref:ImcF-related family protein n=1 Tax=Serratia sp. DD3 TaxID=1410619 RepID=UPI0004D598E1|nr:ImcF-related family protein [Serratia sp. DD3]KEY59818.1 type VI secretion protein IcmF [Serratia sp. DD3]